MDIFICGVCREKFNDISLFLNHKKSLPESLTCEVCGATFHDKQEVINCRHQDVGNSSHQDTPDVEEESTADKNKDSNPNASVTFRIVYTEDEENIGSGASTAYDAGTQFVSSSLNEIDNIELDVVESRGGGDAAPANDQIALSGSQEFPSMDVKGVYTCKLCNAIVMTRKEIISHLNVRHKKCDDAELLDFVTKFVPINLSDANDPAVQLSKLKSSWNTVHLEMTVDAQPLELLVNPKHSQTEAKSGLKRKRGRPRKNDAQNKKIGKKDDEVEGKEGKKPFEIGSDGKYVCQQCKRSFTKERHILGHRCWGSNSRNGEGSDLTKKVETSGPTQEPEGDEHSEDEEDTDLTDDFKLYLPPRTPQRGRGRGRGNNRGRRKRGRPCNTENQNKCDGNENRPENKENVECTLTVMDSTGTDCRLEENTEPRNPTKSSFPFVHYMPVFNNEQQKIDFEEQLNNFDMSSLSNLFTRRVVEQHLTSQGSALGRDKLEFDIYICNVCKKVFKSLSHMKLHCLIHTDIRPFKCPTCTYTSNSKGNLYTHMRKHTGNYFICSVCGFKSCNRSHLAEHEATHTQTRHICQLCQNDYSTLKSLVNHVRKYHGTNREGKEYLATFLMKSNKNAAVLHLCQVCNRSFKKQVDRDRHLFVHNINDNPFVLKCELCDYMASRRNYLENHFRKHRVVYVCMKCPERFVSAIQLSNHVRMHLSEGLEHEEDVPASALQELFYQCLNLSWFLPEPEGLLGTYQFTNIPPELLQQGEDKNVTTNDDGNAGSSEQVQQEGVVGKTISHQLEETDNSANDKTEDGDWMKNGTDIIKVLNYKSMTVEIYSKICEAFGCAECKDCGRRFHTSYDLEQHSLTHSDVKPFKCPKCVYSSTTKDNLRRHVETIHEKKRFPCAKCDHVSISRTSHWHHQLKHKMLSKECPECQQKFSNSADVRAHLTVAHPEVSPSQASQVTGQSQRIQGRLGRRSYKCPYCSRVFRRSTGDLQKHMWIHEGVKPFKCHLCSHSCRSQNNLNVHMQRHSIDKPHLCSHCGKSYKSRAALSCHMKAHSESEVFSCNRCNYKASQRSHLKRHMETHEITKRYTCKHCYYSSNTMGYMKVHYTRKHKGVDFTVATAEPCTNTADAKAYKCIPCNYLFGNLTDLKRHLKVRHDMTVESLKEMDLTEEMAIDNDGPTLEVIPEASDALASEPTFQVLQLDSEVTAEMDESTASAVTILHQMFQQGAFGQRVDEHGLVAVNPESIIVQEEGGEFVVGGGPVGEGQYIIQYLTQMPSDADAAAAALLEAEAEGQGES